MYPTNALTNDEIAELDYLFNDTVCEVQSTSCKKGSVANSVLCNEGDKPTMDSETVLPNSVKREEACELFA